jgi:hypothetical protein
MKTKLTLSALLITTLLAPSAFANPAAVEKQAGAEASTVGTPAVVATAQATPDVNRSVLQRLDLDVRQEVIASLRNGLAEVLQLAAPVLVEIGIQQLDVTER